MKIALCLSGQPRNVPECYNSMIDNLIIPNSIKDIFVFSWWRPEFENTINISKDVLNFIKEKFKPKKFMVENDLEKKWHPRESIVSTAENDLFPRVFAMYYARYRCNLLRKEYCAENNIQYDAIVFSRFDNYFHNKININEFDLTAANSTADRNKPQDINHVNDLIIVGNEKAANVYAEIYNNLPLISSKITHFYGEAINGAWFKLNNISVKEPMVWPRDLTFYRILGRIEPPWPR